jgi:hypothetical protein
VFPAGVAVSALVGGRIFARISTPSLQWWLMSGLLLASVLASGTLVWLPPAAHSEAEVQVRAVLVCVAGFGVGIPYYIVFGMFCTKVGGSHAGVLSCYLDAASFAASAASLTVSKGRLT